MELHWRKRREILSRLTHKFVDEQYECWNDLHPALAEQGIRVLGMHELDAEARRFVDEYCEKELDPLLTPVTVDPTHPFPRVINKASLPGFSSAPPAAFRAHLYRRGLRAARSASPGPVAF